MRDGVADSLSHRRGFLLALAGYLSLVYVVRVFLFAGASEDDAEQLIYAQLWAWGYKPAQPPLYSWLVMVFQLGLGVGIPAVETLKFLTLFALYGFYYLAAAEILDDQRLAGLATLTVLGFFFMAWDAVINYSHTVLLGATIAGALWAVVRLRRSSGLGAYALAGLWIGVGLLSKYNFVLFLAALLAAAAAEPVLRRRLLCWRVGVSVIVAAAVAAPFYIWFLSAPEGLASAQASATPFPHSDSFLKDSASGVFAVLRGAASIVLPGIAIMALVFPRAWRRRPGGVGLQRFLEVYFISLAVIVFAVVIGLRVTFIQNHWLLVVMPLPIYGFLRIAASGPTRARLNGYAGVMCALALAAPLALAFRFVTGPGYCKKCNFFMPYAALSDQIMATGFRRGTIVAFDNPHQLGGNLRRFFPESRVVSPRYLPFVPPLTGRAGDCLIVWNAVRGDDMMKEGSVHAFLRGTLKMQPPSAYRLRYAEAAIPRSDGKRVRLGYVVIDGGAGDCR